MLTLTLKCEVHTCVSSSVNNNLHDISMEWLGGSHTSPTRFSAGTLALSNTNSAVIEALMPHYAGINRNILVAAFHAVLTGSAVLFIIVDV